jgi:hypothetical protein
VILGAAGVQALSVLHKLSRWPRIISGIDSYWLTVHGAWLWNSAHNKKPMGEASKPTVKSVAVGAHLSRSALYRSHRGVVLRIQVLSGEAQDQETRSARYQNQPAKRATEGRENPYSRIGLRGC